MRAFRALLILLVLALAGGGAYEWWNLFARFQPHTVTKDQAQIGKILQASGWVSPGLSGAKLYVIAYRDCAACVQFEQEAFDPLHAAGVDTRVIMIARDDLNGVAQSTPAERATVAELWFNRSWPLLQKWLAAPSASWTAAGIAPADGDVARSAVVEAGPATVDRLTPLLKDNGVGFSYPLLVWWTKDGAMRACACDNPKSFSYVRRDLGVN